MGITNVAAIVRTHGAERPDRTAIVYGDRTITWRELDERSNAAAAALADAGVGPQDRVARIDKNDPSYYEMLYGAAKLNAVLVDVNWRLAPPEMVQIVNDAEAKVLFVGPDFVPVLEKIGGELTTVTRIVVLEEGSATHVSYESWLGAQAGAADPGIVAEGSDVALQLYTSGTTGLPKGVMLTHDNLFSFVNEVAPTWGFTGDSVSIVVMPLFHIAGSGWSIASMVMAAKCVLLRDVDPTLILEKVETERVTHAIFVPAVLQFLLMTPTLSTTDLSSFELIAYGASPITEKVLRASMDAFGCKFVQVYGLTETTGAVVQLDAEDHDPDGRPELLRSCGKPYPWVELRIVDEAGDDVPDGDVGELWIRSVQVMKGYWSKPEETAAALTPDGWFKSGDAGYRKDGFVYLHDRVKDMIVSGGENVYPAEVENALMAHPEVADVGVIGVPDERWGESVHAVVVRAEGSEIDPQGLIAFARERLAGFKCPKSISFTDALPRNPSGKILKRELREPYWAGQQRRIN
ncbi:MAG TPA: long-chain-fatty-acid--CoA ligase [Acidimicrobiales bacterium]|nr:long-chain-fatty-acid--CoA ligase [Acidimicrobiales bacterium]